MKLQVKDSGAWRNVVSFNPEREQDVQAAGAALMQVQACDRTVLRIVDGDQVLSYCEAPFTAWRPA